MEDRFDDLVEQRALLVAQMASIINTLNESQIDIVGQLYQSIVANDENNIDWARAEQRKTRDSLRAIKNAEKILPLYKAHNKGA